MFDIKICVEIPFSERYFAVFEFSFEMLDEEKTVLYATSCWLVEILESFFRDIYLRRSSRGSSPEITLMLSTGLFEKLLLLFLML